MTTTIERISVQYFGDCSAIRSKYTVKNKTAKADNKKISLDKLGFIELFGQDYHFFRISATSTS
jgi:hypothetical protein